MAQISVSLPDDLMAWANRQVAEGRYESVGAYLIDLVARDMDHAEKPAALKAAIEKGVASEPTDASIADITARRNRDVDSDPLDALRKYWAQGIDSGSSVDGSFNADDIARRSGQSREAITKQV